MDKTVEKKLEELGPKNVRMLLSSSHVGEGPGSTVNIGLEKHLNPRREEVQNWLAKKDVEKDRREDCRHRQLLFWGILAFIAAAISAIFSGISIFGK